MAGAQMLGHDLGEAEFKGAGLGQGRGALQHPGQGLAVFVAQLHQEAGVAGRLGAGAKAHPFIWDQLTNAATVVDHGQKPGRDHFAHGDAKMLLTVAVKADAGPGHCFGHSARAGIGAELHIGVMGMGPEEPAGIGAVRAPHHMEAGRQALIAQGFGHRHRIFQPLARNNAPKGQNPVGITLGRRFEPGRAAHFGIKHPDTGHPVPFRRPPRGPERIGQGRGAIRAMDIRARNGAAEARIGLAQSQGHTAGFGPQNRQGLGVGQEQGRGVEHPQGRHRKGRPLAKGENDLIIAARHLRQGPAHQRVFPQGETAGHPTGADGQRPGHPAAAIMGPVAVDIEGAHDMPLGAQFTDHRLGKSLGPATRRQIGVGHKDAFLAHGDISISLGRGRREGSRGGPARRRAAARAT